MSKTALLVLDLQQGILPMLGDVDRDGYVKRVADVAQQARDAGVQVILVRTAFRPGFVDACPRNKFIGTLAEMGRATGQFTQGHQSAGFDPAIAPAPGSNDIVVTKNRTSAFPGTDLELVLRSLDVDALALAGVATSGCVLSTLRQAADLDYVITVVEDLCLDPNPGVHRVLMEDVFPTQATVSSSSGWVNSLGKRG